MAPRGHPILHKRSVLRQRISHEATGNPTASHNRGQKLPTSKFSILKLQKTPEVCALDGPPPSVHGCLAPLGPHTGLKWPPGAFLRPNRRRQDPRYRTNLIQFLQQINLEPYFRAQSPACAQRDLTPPWPANSADGNVSRMNLPRNHPQRRSLRRRASGTRPRWHYSMSMASPKLRKR